MMRNIVWSPQTNKTQGNMVIGFGLREIQNWVWRDQNQLVMENVGEVVMETLIPLEISLLILLPWVVRVSSVRQSKKKIQIQSKGVQRCTTSEEMTKYRVQWVIL